MKALRPLLPYLARHRWRLVMGLTLVVASSALWSVSPWLLRSALDGMRSGAPVSHAWTMAGWMIGASIVAGVMRYGMRELLNSLSRLIEFELRNDLFTHLLALDASYFGRTRTGEIMARLTNDLSAVRMTAGPAIMYLMSTVAGGLFALAFMLRIDVRLTILALLPMILLPISMVGLGRAIHSRFEAVQEHFGAMTTRVQENLSGTRIVRAYRQEEPEIARFGAMSREYEARNVRLAQLYGIMNPSFALLGGLGGVIVLGVGGSLVVRGSITVGAFVAFGLYLAMLTWPLIALGWVINLFQRGAASMARLNEILETRSALDVAMRPARLPEAQGGRTIEFRGVGFRYPTREGDAPRWVLRDVSFSVAGGSTLGVVGATGSGKSTLLDLIPRVYDPTEGDILLDGVPLRALPLDVVRRELGVVPQESLLFSDTIKSNLLYGTDDSASFLDAARVAQLDQTILDFPGGYETQLGERGINLSGGQKQRAALARALARDPSVVLLDDALSAVDTHTEAEILHGLRSALRGRTTIIASHRISAIRDADEIIVLDGGRVVEQGRHADLMALGGRYAALLARQQVEEEVERRA